MREATVIAIAGGSPQGHPAAQAPADPSTDLICEDPTTRRVLDLAGRVARTNASVMICGESGTGKEMLARWIHAHSRRAGGPFVAVNCAAIPAGMLEATLFGHEKGAFTGAHQARIGKFEQAQCGTLLLDEISEMDLDLQAKLLRVLQEREIERLGGRRTIALDVRILATTNRDLTGEVAAGNFRMDLYYRLNVFPLTIPPLSERPGDVLPLVLARLALHVPPGTEPPALDREARDKLLAHDWPGNVRELDNVIQRALILHSGSSIRAEDIVIESIAPAAAQGPAAQWEEPDETGLDRDLRVRERDLIIEALRLENGNRQAAAQRLGISPRTLRYKIARLREQGLGMPVILQASGA